MKLLDARSINTAQGLEIYLDSAKSIEIKEIHIPTIDNPSYEVQFGIEYFLLRKERHYHSQKNYFCICMNPEFNFMTLKETEIESLFAVKSEEEREATKKLLGEWFVNTNSYKATINEFIQRVKKENVYTDEDIQQKIKTISFLERLLALTTEDIELAPIEKSVQLYALSV